MINEKGKIDYKKLNIFLKNQSYFLIYKLNLTFLSNLMGKQQLQNERLYNLTTEDKQEALKLVNSHLD